MKRIKTLKLLVAVVLIGLMGFSYERYREEYTPILMKRSELEKAIVTDGPEAVKKAHQVHLKGDLIFIVELYEGIHVINNADPAHPVNQHFIRIPGCTDVSTKGAYIYADSGEDLVTLHWNGSDVVETGRVRTVFPEILNPEGRLPYLFDKQHRPENTIIVGWEKSES